eukprot:7115786-Pyramimonas_sp.AAC.4
MKGDPTGRVSVRARDDPSVSMWVLPSLWMRRVPPSRAPCTCGHSNQEARGQPRWASLPHCAGHAGHLRNRASAIRTPLATAHCRIGETPSRVLDRPVPKIKTVRSLSVHLLPRNSVALRALLCFKQNTKIIENEQGASDGFNLSVYLICDSRNSEASDRPSIKSRRLGVRSSPSSFSVPEIF